MYLFDVAGRHAEKVLLFSHGVTDGVGNTGTKNT